MVTKPVTEVNDPVREVNRPVTEMNGPVRSVNNLERNYDQTVIAHVIGTMTPQIRAKKDKCTFVVSVDQGKLRVFGVQESPLIVLEGRRSWGWSAQPNTPAPPDPQ